MSAHPITEDIIAAIVADADKGVRVAPALYSAYWPRANVSAAFRLARSRGLIVVDYTSVVGTPVYRKALRLAAPALGGGQ